MMRRDHGTGYASAAAPIPDRNGPVRFALSVIGAQATLAIAPGSNAITALPNGAARASLGKAPKGS